MDFSERNASENCAGKKQRSIVIVLQHLASFILWSKQSDKSAEILKCSEENRYSYMQTALPFGECFNMETHMSTLEVKLSIIGQEMLCDALISNFISLKDSSIIYITFCNTTENEINFNFIYVHNTFYVLTI